MGRGGKRGQEPAASLMEISRVLEETARLVREHAAAEAPGDGPGPAPVGTPQVRAIIALRRLRRQYLGFEPPEAAWHMMLELYAEHLEGRRIYQTRLGTAAGVPQTTAINVTRRLIEAGIFVRSADPDDRRLLLLGLSDNAAERIGAYLATAVRLAPLFA